MNDLHPDQLVDQSLHREETPTFVQHAHQQVKTFTRVAVPSLATLAGGFMLKLQQAGLDLTDPAVHEVPKGW